MKKITILCLVTGGVMLMGQEPTGTGAIHNNVTVQIPPNCASKNTEDTLVQLVQQMEKQLQTAEAELKSVKESAAREKQEAQNRQLQREKDALAMERQSIEVEKAKLEKQKQQEEEARRKAEEAERFHWKNPIDPNSPDPYKSWSTEQKVQQPVNYMKQAIIYVKKKRDELNVMRYNLGVMSKNWKLKKEDAERVFSGSQSVLKKAVACYVQAEKTNDWPVSFGYKSYDKQEMEQEIFRKYKSFKIAKNEYGRIVRGYQQISDTVNVCNEQMTALERKIQVYSDQLELFQSGKMTEEVKKMIGDLDKTIAEQQQAMDVSLAKVQTDVFASTEQERNDATMNLSSIIKEFGK